MRFLVICLTAFCGMTANQGPAFRYGRGTTAVVMRSSRLLVAGIDSRETWMQYREGTVQSEKGEVCKAARIGSGYVLATGLDRDSDGYSALREAVESWQPGDTLDQLAARAGDAISPRLVSLLSRIRADAPADFAEHFQGQTVLQLSFLGVEGRTPQVVILEFSEGESSPSSLNVALRKIRCPGDCNASSTAYFLGTHGAIDEAVRREPHLISPPAGKNVAALIQLESLRRPDIVGGPVAVVEADRSLIAMVNPGACSK